jgi:hypothetical protein
MRREAAEVMKTLMSQINKAPREVLGSAALPPGLGEVFTAAAVSVNYRGQFPMITGL